MKQPRAVPEKLLVPRTVCKSAHGSREVGMLTSSACVKLVAAPVDRVSTTGEGATTVTVSWTLATRIVTGRSTLDPTVTNTSSRTTVVKPAISSVSL